MLNAKRGWGRVRKTPDGSGRFRCSLCMEWKEPSAFNKNRSQTSGLNYACRECMLPRTRRHNLAAKYKITLDQYDEMMAIQCGKCACCGIEFDENAGMLRACIDHRHSDGLVRDILCSRCNLAAGNVKDSVELAEKLLNYLRKWNC